MKEKKLMTTAHSFVLFEGYFYYSSINNNGLYRFDLKTKTTEFIGYFPEEKMNGRHLHSKAICIEGKIYFTPMSANYISIYDVNKNTIESINISNTVGSIESKYYDCVNDNDYIYFIPSRARYIIKMNINNWELSYHDEWNDCINLEEKTSIPIFKSGSFIYESNLYIPYGRDNSILIINTHSFEVARQKIGNLEYGFVDAIFEKENQRIWLLGNCKKKLVEYHLSNKSICEYDISNGQVESVYPYIRMIDLGDKIFIPAYQQDISLIFVKETKECCAIDFESMENEENKDWNAYHFSAHKISEDDIWITNTGDYSILRVHRNMLIKEKIYLEDRLMKKRLYMNSNLVRESRYVNVKDYLKYVMEGSKYVRFRSNE